MLACQIFLLIKQEVVCSSPSESWIVLFSLSFEENLGWMYSLTIAIVLNIKDFLIRPLCIVVLFLFSCELLLLFSSSGRLLRRIFISSLFCHNKPDGKEAWAPQLCRRLHQEAQSQSLLLGKNLARWSWPEVAQGHGWQGHIDPRGDHQVGHRLDQLQQVSVIVSVLEQMVEKCTRLNFLVDN